jgi:hypothetical protein
MMGRWESAERSNATAGKEGKNSKKKGKKKEKKKATALAEHLDATYSDVSTTSSNHCCNIRLLL